MTRCLPGLARAVPAVLHPRDRRPRRPRPDGGDPDLPYGPGAEEGRQVPAYRSVQEELEGSHPATFLVAVTYTLFYTLATWSLAWGTKTVEQGGGNLASPTRSIC